MSDWSIFQISEKGKRPPKSRHVTSKEGIGDRLRAAAFAEIQARDAFLWAADKFNDVPESLKGAWRGLAKAEQKHLDWLLGRMKDLNVDPKGRAVSDVLWHSYMACQTAEEFSVFMACAEDRGRAAGERFCEALKDVDPISSKIFGTIAYEEIEHIELARKYFSEAIDGKLQ